VSKQRRTPTSVSLFSTLAVKGALDSAILPAFEKASGVRIERTFDPTTVLLRRIDEGARPDVIICTSESFDHLATSGIVDDATRVPIARTGVGIASAKTDARPDISTVEALVETLLKARSVAYSRTGASGLYFARLIEELGISAEINAFATVIEKGFTALAIVDGRADLAVQQLSELAFVAGVDVVGPIPEAIQQYTEFSAGIGTQAAGKTEAHALMGSLIGESARGAYAHAGLRAL
jgi:molybdate transport system substrate-binding protein